MSEDTTPRDTVSKTVDDTMAPPLAPAAPAASEEAKPSCMFSAPQALDKSSAPTGAPAKRGGANNTRHGLYGAGLPKDCERVGRRLSAFRRSLCEAVESRAGEIDLHAAATIDSACQWQRHALLAARWLRVQHDELSPDQRLAFSREVARASTERDRCIRLLGLDQPAGQVDPDAIYAQLRANIAQRRLEAQAGAPNDEAANLRPANDEYARPMTPEIAP